MDAPHHILLEERSSLTVSGVTDVERFDDTEILMSTTRGRLLVAGEHLHIETLSLDGGDLRVEGDIDALSYEEDRREPSGGLLSRLLR
jgi:sporulation protein YabP